MKNLESVSQNMAELCILLQFFGLPIHTFMLNLEFVAQKISEFSPI